MKNNFLQLPPIKLDYLTSITDETGIVQHSKFATPNRGEGYTTDDNARALIVCTKHNKLHRNSKTAKLADVYLSFLYHMQMKDGRLHNFLGYDRRFLDDVGSDDSLGRTLWACGYAINSNLDEEKKMVAKEIFVKALPHAINSTSPRTKAFTVLGLGQYQRTYPKDQALSRNMIKLIEQLLKLYEKKSSVEWPWFEAYITYCNGRLPQALFEAYEHIKNEDYLQVAKDSFKFILKIQMNNNIFTPIGNNGWYKKGGQMALILGTNQSFFLPRFKNLGGLNQSLFLLPFLYILLSCSFFGISVLKVTSAENSSFLSTITDKPIFSYPESIPRAIGCFTSPVGYFNCI